MIRSWAPWTARVVASSFRAEGWGPGLMSGDPVGIGFLLLQAAVGAMSGAIVTVFASLFWNPIDY
jgi:hypothetical protein